MVNTTGSNDAGERSPNSIASDISRKTYDSVVPRVGKYGTDALNLGELDETID